MVLKKGQNGVVFIKYEGTWLAYLPEGHDVTDEISLGNVPNVNDSEKKKARTKPIKPTIVTFPSGCTLAKPNSQQIWQSAQYTLLTRVIPGLLSGKHPIAQYRSQLNYSLIQDYAVELIAGSPEKKNIVHHALVLRQPYSNKSAEEIMALSEAELKVNWPHPLKRPLITLILKKILQAWIEES